MQKARLTGLFRRPSRLGILGAALTAAVFGSSSISSAGTPIPLPQLGKRMGSPQRFFQNETPALELESVVSTDRAGNTDSQTNPSSAKSQPASMPTSSNNGTAPRLLPENGAELQRIPTQTASERPGISRLPNEALKAAIQTALPNSNSDADGTVQQSEPETTTRTGSGSGKPVSGSPNTTSPETKPEMSPRSLALRHLSPSRYFQSGEPKLELPAPAIQQTVGLRPVAGETALLEDVPASPPATSPQESQAYFFPANAQPGNLAQDGSANPIPPSPAPDGSSTGTSSGTVAEAEKLGSAPENNNLQFLRSEAVLLDPGQCQFDFGLTYSVLDNDFPIALVDGGGDVVDVAEARTRQRQLIVPLAVRYGLSERIQLFANVPVGWASTEVAYLGTEEESNVGGLGDIDAGASVLIKRASEPYSADIIATISFTSPTGNTSFPDSILEPSDGMGEGYWALSQSLLFVHTIDPVVLFYGIGFRHRFDRDFGRTHVDPGEEINYQFGAGFAVNPWITLSGSVLGAHQTSVEINDLDIEGSGQDPMRLRLSVTAVKGRQIIEPFAEVQMTNDAASRVGVVFTY